MTSKCRTIAGEQLKSIQIHIENSTLCVRTRIGLANDEEDEEQNEENAAVELARGPDDLGIREARRGVERVGHLEDVLEEVGGVRVGRRGESRHDRGGDVCIGSGASTRSCHLVGNSGYHHGRRGRGSVLLKVPRIV